MRINEIIDSEEQPKYAIQIMMVGDVGRPGTDTIIQYYRKNPQIPLERATHSQDFAALRGKQPTLFTDKAIVIERAKQVQAACNRIKYDLAQTKGPGILNGIHREFFVKPVIWKGSQPT